MSITHATVQRDGMADLVADAHDAGAGTSVLEIRAAAVVLASFNLPNPAFGASAAGIATLLGTPIGTVGVADGNADNFVTRDRDGTQIVAGSVTGVGMGGDIELTNIAIAVGQTVTLNSLTYAAPA